MNPEVQMSAPSDSTRRFRAFGFCREFLRFTRMHEWHPGKIPLILGFVFILALAAPDPNDLTWVVLAYVLSSLYLATGYMLNNLSDAKQDQAVNKRMGLAAVSWQGKMIPVCLTTVLGLALGWVFLPPAAFAALVGCHLLAWIYSFPPRLKEHVWLGPLVGAFAQVTAPALTLAAARGSLPPIGGLYLVVTFLYGIRMLMVHQIIDHDNDVQTATRTTATVVGLVVARRMVRWTFAAELLGSLILVPLAVRAGVPVLFVLVLGWPVAMALLRWCRGEVLGLEGYAFIPLADVHESLMPLILVAALVQRDGGLMIGVLLLVLLLFAKRHFERLVQPLFRWSQSYA